MRTKSSEAITIDSNDIFKKQTFMLLFLYVSPCVNKQRCLLRNELILNVASTISTVTGEAGSSDRINFKLPEQSFNKITRVTWTLLP
jgi:hypothetical protein